MFTSSPATAAIPGQGVTGRPAAAAEGQGRNGMISSDFQTFLKMLTTQMRNQDPTNPMEATDFAVQLATFSSVEQQVRTNQLLESLMGQSAVAELAGLVGMGARVSGPVPFDGMTGVPLSLPAEPGADSAQLTVRNTLGQIVATEVVSPAGGPMIWRGLGSDGQPLPAGTYSFEVSAFQNGQLVGASQVEAFARVVEARRDEAGTMLVLAGGREVPLSAVSALRAADR
jgi:flagellar basal-body rod modification protein FlgD